MVHNLPMVFTTLRLWVLMLLCLLTTVSAQAHPGHEGHEDGGDFTWTYSHVTAHPLASVLWVGAGVLLVWLGRRVLDAQQQPKAGAANSPAAGTLS